MRKLNMDKLAGLQTADALLDSKYGTEGSEQRNSFDAESQAWYATQMEKSYRITMPVELHDTLSQRARQMGQSISTYVSHLLAQDMQLT